MSLKAPIPKNNYQRLLNAVPSNRKYQTAGTQNFTSLERISFFHGSLGGPVIKSVRQAIKAGHLQSWPGMTLQAINKFKEPDATPLGHLDHVRKNI